MMHTWTMIVIVDLLSDYDDYHDEGDDHWQIMTNDNNDNHNR